MKDNTCLDPEEFACPHGGFTRSGRAILTKNPNNPIELPYGEIRAVRASIPDTYFPIPARISHKGKRVDGFLTIDSSTNEWRFTPEAAISAKEEAPENCDGCLAGYAPAGQNAICDECQQTQE